MKNLFYSILTLVCISLFASCDPLVNNVGVGNVVTSADQIQATVTPIVVNGQNSNKVAVHCTSPVLCSWTDGILTYVSNDTVMTLFTTGDVTITLNALAADGSSLTKTYSAQVDEMSFPVDPHWELFCGSGTEGKTWVWATDIPDKWAPGVTAGGVYGNGGYLENNAPTWWMPDISTLGVADDKMTFDLNGGANFTLVTGNNQVQDNGQPKGLPAGTYKGSFKFDFSKAIATNSPPGASGGSDWSIGTLTLSGGPTVSLGYQPNTGNFEPITVYNILYLDDNVMMLGCPEPGAGDWGGCWFWILKRQGYTF